MKNIEHIGASGKPRAIETVYRGYRFRSRLEARWAIFFGAMGVRFWDEIRRDPNKLDDAIALSRQARFEYGEAPL